jgi:hypothetical protein
VYRFDHADSYTCLNRQILNTSVKRNAMEDFSERSHKLIRKVKDGKDDSVADYQSILVM